MVDVNQAICDAYGVANYQEFNPAIFSVITFPFLFGVMFGDIGHGFMMALAGGLLVAYEAKLASLASNEMFGTVYKGRYNIVLMGAFLPQASPCMLACFFERSLSMAGIFRPRAQL